MRNTTLYADKMQHIKLQFCNMLKHRGEVLGKVIKDLNIKIVPLAKKMGLDRGTVYRHIGDPQLTLDYILQYGKALNHDFSSDFPELLNILREPVNEYQSTKSYDQWRSESEYWKDKYIDLLERYNALLTQYNGGDKSNDRKKSV